MTHMEKIIYERVRSSYSLSIGTGIAIETLFGMDSFAYDKNRQFERLDPNKFDYCYINLHTLVRNIITSCGSKNKELIVNNIYLLTDVIIEEINNIDVLFRNTNCKLIVFYNDYFKVTYKRFLKPKNDIERFIAATIKLVSMKSDYINENTSCEMIDDFLIKTQKRVIIITHFPVDLLNYTLNKDFVLVESVHGTIVNKLDFNKKYPKSVYYDKHKLPFNELLLRLLGDNRILEKPFKDIRKEVGEIAEKRKWIPTTSQTVVKSHLNATPNTRDAVNATIRRLIYK